MVATWPRVIGLCVALLVLLQVGYLLYKAAPGDPRVPGEQAIPAYQPPKPDVDSIQEIVARMNPDASDSSSRAWTAHAKRLATEEERLGLIHSLHFDLQVEDQAFAEGPRLLDAMEKAYDALCLIWKLYPEQRIAAVLYTSKIYQGRDDLPDWTGALFDGKVRNPANIMENWPTHRPIIFHEVAHAFHRELASGNALPIWLEEGLAQDFDGTVLDMAVIQNNPLRDSLQLYNEFLHIADSHEARALYQHSLYRTRRLLAHMGRDSLANWIRQGADPALLPQAGW